MTWPKSPEWEERLSSLPRELWLSRIAEYTPPQVKSLLASHQPPSIAQLQSLGWANTADAGVYLCFLRPKGGSGSVKEMGYVYAGSGTGAGSGLSGRRRCILSSSTGKDSLKSKISKLDLDLEKNFVVLFRVPFDVDVHDARVIATLARLVYMIWLGAVDEELKPKIKYLVPWLLEDVKYRGLAKDDPLARNLPGLKNIEIELNAQENGGDE
jgi:hypothetical protein